MSGPEVVAGTPEPVSADRDVFSGPDVASLDAFVRDHYPRLVRLAGLITRDADQAQDAVQAALERAWRKRTELRNTESMRFWLDRIVAREALRQAGGRFARLVTNRSSDWVDPDPRLPGLEPVEVAELREALGRLTPEQRAVIGLHLHAGYSVEATAHILSIPFDTVRSRLRAARERLRRDLREAAP